MYRPEFGMYKTASGVYKYAGLGGLMLKGYVRASKYTVGGGLKLGKELVTKYTKDPSRIAKLIKPKHWPGFAFDLMMVPVVSHAITYPVKGPLGFAKETTSNILGALTGPMSI